LNDRKIKTITFIINNLKQDAQPEAK